MFGIQETMMNSEVKAVDATMPVTGTYSVKDIYMAAYLSYRGYELLECNRVTYNSEFIFKDVPQQVIRSYYNRKPEEVSVKELFDAFKALRSLATHISKVPDKPLDNSKQQSIQSPVEREEE
jgi:hypothetical protein